MDDAPRRYIFVKFLTARVNTFFMFVTFFDCNCLVYDPRKKTVRIDCNVSLARVKGTILWRFVWYVDDFYWI